MGGSVVVEWKMFLEYSAMKKKRFDQAEIEKSRVSFKGCCTFNASSWLTDVNGVPFTSSIESPGLKPARSAKEPSSMRDTYTPWPASLPPFTQMPKPCESCWSRDIVTVRVDNSWIFVTLLSRSRSRSRSVWKVYKVVFKWTLFSRMRFSFYFIDIKLQFNRLENYETYSIHMMCGWWWTTRWASSATFASNSIAIIVIARRRRWGCCRAKQTKHLFRGYWPFFVDIAAEKCAK